MVDYLQGAAACAIVSGFDIWSSGSSKECWTHWGPSRQLHDLTSQFHLYWDKLGLIDMLNLLLFPESLLAFNWPTGSWNSCARIKRPCNSYNGWSDGKNYNKPLVTLIAERLQFHAISINILYSISTNFNRCTMLHHAAPVLGSLLEADSLRLLLLLRALGRLRSVFTLGTTGKKQWIGNNIAAELKASSVCV